MNRILFLLGTLLAIGTVCAQEEQDILDEGFALYYSEMASWNGTDLFLDQLGNKRDQSGGYFSYTDETGHSHCVFFNRSDVPEILAIFSFDSTFLEGKVLIDTLRREFTAYEKELFTIRQKALNRVREDSTFILYEHTSFNIIPLIRKGEKKVYVLTGPQASGVVIFGNDYLLRFNDLNEIESVSMLHRNILPVDFGEPGEAPVTTMHSHATETGELITPTDICTLLLYGPYANWSMHVVVGKKKVSLWNCDTQSLLILDRKAFEKISKDVEKREKKKRN